VNVAPEKLVAYAGLYEIREVPQGILSLRPNGNQLAAHFLSSVSGAAWLPISNAEFVDSWGSGTRLHLTHTLFGRKLATFTSPQGRKRRAARVADPLPESFSQPIPQPLAQDASKPREGSDLQGTWEVTAGLWYWPFASQRGKLRVAEPSAGTFQAEFDVPALSIQGLPVFVRYAPPHIELIARSGAGMFKGKINADCTKMTGQYIVGRRSLGMTLRRSAQ
jgi:hypothetical protein